jgi:hypothetical protein
LGEFLAIGDFILFFKNVIRDFFLGAIDRQILKSKKKKCQIPHQVQIGSQQ